MARTRVDPWGGVRPDEVARRALFVKAHFRQELLDYLTVNLQFDGLTVDRARQQLLWSGQIGAVQLGQLDQIALASLFYAVATTAFELRWNCRTLPCIDRFGLLTYTLNLANQLMDEVDVRSGVPTRSEWLRVQLPLSQPLNTA